MWKIRLLVCAAVGLALACARGSSESRRDSAGAQAVPAGGLSAAPREGSCDKRELDALRAVDSTRLTRRELSTEPGQSAEGSSAFVYLDVDRPQLVVATYFGETGRAVERYYVRDSLTFVLEEGELHYDKPIAQGPPAVASEAEQAPLYVCQGRVVQGPADADVGDALATIASLLRQLRKGN
jgi:hypothetical protein